MAADVPPRLHVIIARRAPVAVVFRRGPSRAVATLRWDLTEDTLTLGQWLRGRIYARRSDISPDGRHVIYFAMDGRWGSPLGGSWTAVARTGWLKALALWAKGDCWNGGGLFLDNRRYWLNDGPFRHREAARWSGLVRVPNAPLARPGSGECPGIYLPRLIRDGWRLVSEDRWGAELHRDLPAGWRLIKFFHADPTVPVGKGVYWEEHLLSTPGGRLEARPDWEWAERAGSEVLFAEQGALWRQPIAAPKDLPAPRLVADLGPMAFEARPAPY